MKFTFSFCTAFEQGGAEIKSKPKHGRCRIYAYAERLRLDFIMWFLLQALWEDIPGALFLSVSFKKNFMMSIQTNVGSFRLRTAVESFEVGQLLRVNQSFAPPLLAVGALDGVQFFGKMVLD